MKGTVVASKCNNCTIEGHWIGGTYNKEITNTPILLYLVDTIAWTVTRYHKHTCEVSYKEWDIPINGVSSTTITV